MTVGNNQKTKKYLIFFVNLDLNLV